MDQLSKLRDLKADEKRTMTILESFKTQLNRLKVEELCVAGKIRDCQVTNFETNINKVTNDSHFDSVDQVNKTNLNLQTARHILTQLSRGGGSLPAAEEMEDESEEDD